MNYEIIETKIESGNRKHYTVKLEDGRIIKTGDVKKAIKMLCSEAKEAAKSPFQKMNENIQTWKSIALSVNDKWNRNSEWKLAEETFGKIDNQGNEFISSLLKSMFSFGRLSEKQAYFLAKFAVETNQI